MKLEDRLRLALRRVEPDEDFADRVLAKLDAAPSRARAPARWALAASVVLAVGIASMAGYGAWQQHTHRLETERLQARNEAASRQLAYALELTSRELEGVHRHLERKTEETGS